MRHRNESKPRIEFKCLLMLVILIAWESHAAAQVPATQNNQLTVPFSQSASTALSDIYRWIGKASADAKASLTSADYGQNLKIRSYEEVRQAQLSARTQGDRKAANMLQTHYSNVKSWVNKLVEARKDLDATLEMDPDEVDQDPDLIKINTCEKAFNQMLANGKYAELAECQ